MAEDSGADTSHCHYYNRVVALSSVGLPCIKVLIYDFGELVVLKKDGGTPDYNGRSRR